MKQIYHGNVLTMSEDMRRSVREAENAVFPDGILTEDGIIRRVGSFDALRKEAPEAEVFDYGNGTILPGFIDGHSHLSAVAYSMILFNAKPSPSGNCDTPEQLIEEAKKFLRTITLEPGQWFLGLGYDNAVFPGERHLTRQELDQISTEIPIAITHVSGHLCAVNTKAMELYGYDKPGCDVPAGGEVDASGLLKEEAFLSPAKASVVKGPSPAQLMKALEQASDYYASFGITTMQDGKVRKGELELLKAAGRAGAIRGDVVIYLAPETAEEYLPKQNPAENLYESHCRLGGAKIFLDGSPQGKTAWLSMPYHIVPEGQPEDYCGMPVQEEQDVREFFEKCIRNRWQVNVHANGDAAIEQMLRCYEYALMDTKKGSGGNENLRPVVIHCQTVRREQLTRMAKLGMTASFFLDHVYYWGDYHYSSVLGAERASVISPLRWAEEEKIPFTLHQDSPVVEPNILFSIHNAVNRRTKEGRVLGENQRISVLEALEAVTVHGAYQIFEEGSKGAIEPDRRADFVVLEKNPLETLPEEIKDIRITATVKDGRIIYER
ncbi:amidohydrolase [Qiania dongpingensis]|nr:amidohydrolase [Qiania dongpingensis]